MSSTAPKNVTIDLPDLLRLLDSIHDTRNALTECRDVLRALLEKFIYASELSVFDDAKLAIERAERALKEK